MDIHVVDHPLAASRLTLMRDARSDNAAFRAALKDLGTMLVYEASRDLPVEHFDCVTPVDTAALNHVRHRSSHGRLAERAS